MPQYLTGHLSETVNDKLLTLVANHYFLEDSGNFVYVLITAGWSCG